MSVVEQYERHVFGLKSALNIIQKNDKKEAIRLIEMLISGWEEDILKEKENGGN